jgi:exodeoxyribonuclease-3
MAVRAKMLTHGVERTCGSRAAARDSASYDDCRDPYPSGAPPTERAMKLATWNVNSLKVRLPHLLDWLAHAQPDVVCLQETKLENASFPRAEIEKAGYAACFHGQKAYNGVAILSRLGLADVKPGIGGYEDDHRRVLSATVADVRVICLYVPNGQAVGTNKYEYKLQWLDALSRWLDEELRSHERVAVLGDYNIAPENVDVHNPKRWAGQVLFSEPERAAFQRLLALGFEDAFRLFAQKERSFTWWDYRLNAFQKDMGLRIDHILLSRALARRCRACWIDLAPRRLERPSDHAPVLAELER